MRKESVYSAYKVLTQMRALADSLDEAIKKEDLPKIEMIKQKMLELQRSLNTAL